MAKLTLPEEPEGWDGEAPEMAPDIFELRMRSMVWAVPHDFYTMAVTLDDGSVAILQNRDVLAVLKEQVERDRQFMTER